MSQLLPPLEQLASDLTSAAGKAALEALGGLFGFGNGDSGMSIIQLGAALLQIEQDIVNILCKIATLIGPDYPQAAATIQTIM